MILTEQRTGVREGMRRAAAAVQLETGCGFFENHIADAGKMVLVLPRTGGDNEDDCSRWQTVKSCKICAE